MEGDRKLHKLQLPQADEDYDANDRKRQIPDAAAALLDYDAADDTAKRELFSKLAEDLESFRYVPDVDLRMHLYGHNSIKADPLYSGDHDGFGAYYITKDSKFFKRLQNGVKSIWPEELTTDSSLQTINLKSDPYLLKATFKNQWRYEDGDDGYKKISIGGKRSRESS